MHSDILVIGGGIAGLYTAYQLLKRHPGISLTLLEKHALVGGRMDTYHDDTMVVEAGAGRFHTSHRRLRHLIDELGLSRHVVPIGHDIAFMTSQHPGEKLHTLPELEGLDRTSSATSSLPCDPLIRRLMRLRKTVPSETLRSMTLLEFAKQTFGDDRVVSVIPRTFGYYSELGIMNADDSLHLMETLLSKQSFFGMKGGLSLVVQRLTARLREMGAKIIEGQSVVSIRRSSSSMSPFSRPRIRRTRKLGGAGVSAGFKIRCSNGNTYSATQCVCALPRQAIQRLQCPLFQRVEPDLKQILCGSLCRIYCQFAKGKDGKVWFHDLGKITTDNDLRMIIPIDVARGIAMISYSDNRWADEWNRLYRDEGVRAVNQKLRQLTQSLMGPGVVIPIPTHTRVFYWKCGVGYWGKGANSGVAERRIRQPARGLYVCGEHYSSRSQQWMEGALDTAANVVRAIRMRKTRHNI